MNGMEKLKMNYENIEIPSELEFIVKNTMKKENKKMQIRKRTKIAIATAAALTIAFVGMVNLNASIAYALSEVPLFKEMVRVVSFRDFKIQDNNFVAELETPKIEGLENQELENLLNDKYLNENKELYEKFLADIEDLKKAGFKDANMGVLAGYEIKTDNEDILSIERYVVSVAGSSSTVLKYDTIDRRNEILITLPSLFKDESYIDIISQNIREQMIQRMEEDENLVYWLKEEVQEWNFDEISKNQKFYINNDYKLVISFDKYEVAPGYMGISEFIIPTELIQETLVSNAYIR